MVAWARSKEWQNQKIKTKAYLITKTYLAIEYQKLPPKDVHHEDCEGKRISAEVPPVLRPKMLTI